MSDELHVSHLRWKRLRNFVLIILALVGGTMVSSHVLSGSIVLLDIDGVVVRDRVAVASPFPETRIHEVFVRPGDQVSVGQKIAVVESPSVSSQLANLAVEKAKLDTSLAGYEARQAAVEALLPVAEAASQQINVSLDRLAKANAKGIVPDKTLTDTLSTNLATSDKLLSLKAEQASLTREIAAQREALRDVTASYEALKQIYAGGILYAPADGIVGSEVEPAGSVLGSANAVVAEIFTGPSFVLAYLPSSYAFSIEAGERVKIRAASRWTVGTIHRLLPLTEAVPPEFQLPTKVRSRGQLVKVALPPDADFPLGEKILLSGCYFDTCSIEPGIVARLEPLKNVVADTFATVLDTVAGWTGAVR